MRNRIASRFSLSCTLVLLLAGCEATGPVEKADVSRVVRKLEKGSASGRSAAEKRLYETPPDLHWEEVLPLVERKSAPVEVRAAAIRVIGHTCGELGIPGPVMRVAADPEPVLRKEAAAAIVAYGDPAYILPLHSRRNDATDDAVRADLDALIAKLEAGKQAWYRKRVTTAGDLMERAMAARWLAEIGTKEDVPALIAAFKSPDGDGLTRQEAVLALARIGGDDAKAFLRPLLSSPDGYTRGAAAIAQLSLLDPAAVPDLQRLVAEDTVGDIRVTAVTALGKIGGADAKAALDASCTAGHPDERVKAACSEAQKTIAKGS